MRKTALRRISARRLAETDLYRFRRRRFLLEHPYCQVWLAEHGVSEDVAIQNRGCVPVDGSNGQVHFVPLSTEIHHKNKRRGCDLLDQTHWLAVSREAHERIESDKNWARMRSFLLAF